MTIRKYRDDLSKALVLGIPRSCPEDRSRAVFRKPREPWSEPVARKYGSR